MEEGTIIAILTFAVGILLFIIMFVNIKIRSSCSEPVGAVCYDYFTQYTGRGVTLYRPKFKYRYEGVEYDECSLNSYSLKKLNKKYIANKEYTNVGTGERVYVDSTR